LTFPSRREVIDRADGEERTQGKAANEARGEASGQKSGEESSLEEAKSRWGRLKIFRL
jgi:hypothetical protein